ncbi:unnamed protein product [Camellia sinensis]
MREEKKRETRRCLLTLSAAAILPPADSLAAAIYAADIENRVREREEEEREETLPPDAPPPQPSCRRRRPAAADSRKIQKWRNLRKLACNQKNGRNSSVKAIYSSKDDLQIPSSPYFPAYDYAYAQGQGQGLPPMMQESFQSVISQLFQHARLLMMDSQEDSTLRCSC